MTSADAARPPDQGVGGSCEAPTELSQNLERLAALHTAGSLTDEEFAAAKRLLLDGGAERGSADRGSADRGSADRGWYVDPTRGADWERFWSGRNWTRRTRRTGHPGESSSQLEGPKYVAPPPEARRPDRPEHVGPAPGSMGTNGLAIASFVLGITGWCGIGSLLAIVFGRQALEQIRGSQGAETGDGLADAGIVLGHIGLIAVLMTVVVALVRAAAG